MSYQIKSTPFFRRMLSTSKKNGQLQKLKEEYERMKDFNDRTIEMKMREVRLKRLFQDIEDIKELSYHLPKRSKTTPRKKTADDIRLETFIRAKELGKEFSKLNGLLGPSTSKCSSKERFFHFANDKLTTSKRALFEKGKNYGNENSRANLYKLNSQQRKTQNSRARKRENQNQNQTKEADKNELLKQRLNYGNSMSHINMSKIPKRDVKQNASTDTIAAAKANALDRKNGDIPEQLVPNSVALEGKPSQVLHASETFIREKPSSAHSLVSSVIPPVVNNYEAHIRAKKYWRKVALTMLNRFDKAVRCATRVEDVYSEDNNENEFKLRTISNDTDIPSNVTMTTRNDRTSNSEIGDIEPEPNEDDEVLLHVQPLFAPHLTLSDYNSSGVVPPTSPPEAICSSADEEQAHILNSIKDLREKVAAFQKQPTSDKVHKLAKIFEPFVREAAQKEAFDGVQKLKSIFQSQGE